MDHLPVGWSFINFIEVVIALALTGLIFKQRPPRF